MWVSTQRGNSQNGKLSEDRIKRLEDMGFTWEQLESKWEGMFNTLKEYKEKHGDCNVPAIWRENKQLGKWVRVQRSNYQNSKLSEGRIERLEKIYFVWNVLESQWEEKFNALKEYKENHGHCNVSQYWRENKQLGSWVNEQRNNYRKGKLSKDRIKRLEEIGFVWVIHKG